MQLGSDDFPMMLEVEHGLPPVAPPMAVGFGEHPLLDDQQTREKGFEVYRDVVFVKIATPGDRTSLYFQPATDTHKRRFPKAWNEYNSREKRGGQEGLPIEQWAMISKSTALNLRVLHIHTVEALATVDDAHVNKLPNGPELRAKAKLFIQQRTDAAAVNKAVSEKKLLQDQITALQNQLAALQQRHADSGSVPPVAKTPPTPVQAEEAHERDVEADVAKAVRRPRARA